MAEEIVVVAEIPSGHDFATNIPVGPDFATAQTPCGFPMAIIDNANDVYGTGETPRSIFEQQILQMEAAIRAKPTWWVKICDSEITSRWNREFIEQIVTDPDYDPEKEGNEEYIQKKFTFALAECQWQATRYPGPSRPAEVDRVFCLTDLDERIRGAMMDGVTLLRSRPAIGAAQEDRHPGTPQIVDLVHPSLYCYERTKTRVLPDMGAKVLKAPDFLFLHSEGVVEPQIEAIGDDRRLLVSPSGLQWLPSEFFVMEDGKCLINSYINSLHPEEYSDLYEAIGNLFVHVLPVLEDVLREVGTTYASAPQQRPIRISVPYPWWDQEEDEGDEVEDEGDRIGHFIAPEIPAFKPPVFGNHQPTFHLRNRPLQVIVKIASLELAPGETYVGGVWHVEGTLDERIVATACCYLESINVRGGELQFRNSIREPDYDQYDHVGVRKMYGLRNSDALVQFMGQCQTSAGRVLGWPNTLQHRVLPVELVDPLVPGRRVICCFFLVDPTLRIRSTATVPPQQLAWVKSAMDPMLAQVVAEGAVRDKIVGLLQSDSLLSFGQACERRLRLMHERRQKNFDADKGEPFFVRIFSLCEH